MSLFKVLSHVSITVTDVTKARDFYTGVLGFQEIPRPAFDFPGIWYSLGGDLQLHIILNDQLVRDAVERIASDMFDAAPAMKGYVVRIFTKHIPK